MKKIMRISRRNKSGYTLIEIAAAIAVMVALAAIVIAAGRGYANWSDGKQAADALRAVEAARRLYLADNPYADVNFLNQANLLPYLPGNVWPTLPSVAGGTLTIHFTTPNQPPTLRLGGSVYDPSPSTTDGVWDVGR
jgi:prepilin-type N-terminal cleavage/methylation domain-containing protein